MGMEFDQQYLRDELSSKVESAEKRDSVASLSNPNRFSNKKD